MDIGEAYLVCGKGYDALLCEMLFYAEQELSISNGVKMELRVSVIKSQASHLKLLESNGYECYSSEPICIYKNAIQDERNCPECGSEMESVGKDFIRDELVYVPAKLFLRKHYAEVLKCHSCGNDESKARHRKTGYL